MRGPIAVIQENALGSWSRLRGVEVLVFGDDDGVEALAERTGHRWCGPVPRNRYGTPLLNELFRRAEDEALGERLCYVNADIIFTREFESLRERPPWPALVVGERWNVDQGQSLDWSQDWESELLSRALSANQRGGRYALDWFLFERGLFGRIAALAIGRHYWDNWLVYRARARGAKLIDASERVHAIHQNHGYGHDGQLTDAELRARPEVQENRRLSGGGFLGMDLSHATHIFGAAGYRRRRLGYRSLIVRLPEHAPMYWCFGKLLEMGHSLPGPWRKWLRGLMRVNVGVVRRKK